MKNNDQSPRIKTEAIFLIESNFIRYPEMADVVVPHVDIDYEYSVENQIGQGFITINVKGNAKHSNNIIFESRIRYLGVFSEDEKEPNMSIDDFMKINAPAHIYPFVREFLASLSTRSDMPAIILPPMNVAAMLSIKLEGKAVDNKVIVSTDNMN